MRHDVIAKTSEKAHLDQVAFEVHRDSDTSLLNLQEGFVFQFSFVCLFFLKKQLSHSIFCTLSMLFSMCCAHLCQKDVGNLDV